MSKILPGGRYSAFSAQLTATAPRLTGCHAQHWAMIISVLYDLLQTSLSCVGHKKGVHGCLVASPRADVLGEESAGPMEMGAQPDGPAPGREPWGSRWFVPRGETTAAQCTGQHRLEPVPGRKPRMVARFACLACFACLDWMRTTDHLFWCRWMLLVALVAYSPLPYSHFPP